MPHTVAVICKTCGNEASFEFAEQVLLRTKEDITWFQQSEHFDYEKAQNGDGQSFHRAIYYHGLKTRGLPELVELPEGCVITDWDHPPYKFQTRTDWRGAFICNNCGMRRKHGLDWPEEAYFQIQYKSHTLWAFDRESAAELLDYVEAHHRNPVDYVYWSFLLKIPQTFLSKGARETIVKRLRKRLA